MTSDIWTTCLIQTPLSSGKEEKLYISNTFTKSTRTEEGINTADSDRKYIFLDSYLS
jgi:hypothetical protein